MRIRYRMVRHATEIARTGRVTLPQAQYIARKVIEDQKHKKQGQAREERLARPPKTPEGYTLTNMDLFDYNGR